LDQRAPLLNTLEQARRQIALCHPVAAGMLTVQFVNQIQRLVSGDLLDQATADSLAVCARTIDLCGVYCDASAAAAATNLPACTCIRDVILRVSALPIKPDARKPLLDQRVQLLNTLEQTRRQIALDHPVAAGNRIVQFLRQTQGLVSIGSLDQATADSLAVCAKSVDLSGIKCAASSSNQPPVALAKALVVSADSQCQANPTAAQFDNGSYDPNGVIVSRSVTPPGPYPIGETAVTYTVFDNHGAFSSVATSVTVQDIAGPSVSNFASNFLVFIAPDQSSGTAIFPEPAVSDGCAGVASVSFAPPSGSVFPLGVTPAELIVVDGVGNTYPISFNVVVLPNSGDGGGSGGSNLPPVAIAHAVTNAADVNCEAVVTAAQVDNHSFSPTGIIVSRSVQPTGPFPVGSTTPVTLTVVDDTGASNSAVTTVTVLDLTPPTILTLPTDIAATPALGQQSVVVNYPALSVTDVCSSVAVGVSCTPPSGTAFGMGTNTVTCAVFGGTSNTNSTTFRVIVTAFAVSTACNTIPGLIQQLQAIPLTRTFNAGRQSSMVAKLNQAQLDITQNQLTSAKNVLGGFITTCSTYQSLGVLDSGTASALIICATNIQNLL